MGRILIKKVFSWVCLYNCNYYSFFIKHDNYLLEGIQQCHFDFYKSIQFVSKLQKQIDKELKLFDKSKRYWNWAPITWIVVTDRNPWLKLIETNKQEWWSTLKVKIDWNFYKNTWKIKWEVVENRSC